MDNGGIATEETYPYLMVDSWCSNVTDSGVTVKGYVNMTSSEDALKYAVATYVQKKIVCFCLFIFIRDQLLLQLMQITWNLFFIVPEFIIIHLVNQILILLIMKYFVLVMDLKMDKTIGLLRIHGRLIGEMMGSLRWLEIEIIIVVLLLKLIILSFNYLLNPIKKKRARGMAVATSLNRHIITSFRCLHVTGSTLK